MLRAEVKGCCANPGPSHTYYRGIKAVVLCLQGAQPACRGGGAMSMLRLPGPGFPVIPRCLLERMQRWEYINFSQLIPFCEGEELDPMEEASFLVWKPNWGRAGTKNTPLNSGLCASSYTWWPWQGNSQRPYWSSVPTSTIF